MKVIKASLIKDTVRKLCIQANFVLRKDVSGKILSAFRKEVNHNSIKSLAAIIKNTKVDQAKISNLSGYRFTDCIC